MENPGIETGLGDVFKGERNVFGTPDSREKSQLKDIFVGGMESRWKNDK